MLTIFFFYDMFFQVSSTLLPGISKEGLRSLRFILPLGSCSFKLWRPGWTCFQCHGEDADFSLDCEGPETTAAPQSSWAPTQETVVGTAQWKLLKQWSCWHSITHSLCLTCEGQPWEGESPTQSFAASHHPSCESSLA